MDEKEQYKNLLSEIVAKQSIILGPYIAVLKARNVPELSVADDGKITDVRGNPHDALQKLVDEYVSLAGQIVKNALGSVFAKYPGIQPLNNK